jgi:DNA-binding NtrC family response regulator
MESVIEILIADRNPNVRDFLKRELSACGYHVRLAENEKQLLKLIFSGNRTDLLVLDPDIPGVEIIEIFRKIVDRVPQLPIVIFYPPGNDNISDFTPGNVFLVEKNGHSIEILKAVIRGILTGSNIHAPTL